LLRLLRVAKLEPLTLRLALFRRLRRARAFGKVNSVYAFLIVSGCFLWNLQNESQRSRKAIITQCFYFLTFNGDTIASTLHSGMFGEFFLLISPLAGLSVSQLSLSEI